MPRKQRDYKAEYAKRKAIAQRAGFGSVRKYKRVRKSLELPRTARFNIRAIKQAGRVWSADHSRVANSRYKHDFTDAQAIDYYRAFVLPTTAGKMDRLHAYLVGNDLVTEEEWLANYVRSE